MLSKGTNIRREREIKSNLKGGKKLGKIGSEGTIKKGQNGTNDNKLYKEKTKDKFIKCK